LQGINQIQGIAQVEVLFVCNNKLTTIDSTAFQGFARLKHLKLTKQDKEAIKKALPNSWYRFLGDIESCRFLVVICCE